MANVGIMQFDVIADTHFEMLMCALLFGTVLVIHIVQPILFQDARHLDAPFHGVGDLLQWLQILLRSSIPQVGQVRFDLSDPFLVQLLP